MRQWETGARLEVVDRPLDMHSSKPSLSPQFGDGRPGKNATSACRGDGAKAPPVGTEAKTKFTTATPSLVRVHW
jgi:hypothetical protein